MGNFFPGPGRLGGPGMFFDRNPDTAVAVLATVLRFTVWVLVILAVVWAVREVLRTIHFGHRPVPPPANPALIELDMRYARGEITRSDYLTRRADLGALPLGPTPPAG